MNFTRDRIAMWCRVSSWHAFILLASSLAVLPAFTRIVTVSGDHRVHLGWIEAHTFPNHCGYHLVVEWVGSAGFSTRFAAALVLSIAFGATVFIGYVLIRRLCSLAPWPSTVIAICLSIAAPLPKWWDWPSVYLGNLSGVVWHNPTTILSLPLGLASAGAALLAAPIPTSTARSRLVLTGCVILPVACAFVKPNFLMALAPAAVLALFLRSMVPRYAAGGLLFGCVLGALAYLIATWVNPEEPINPLAPAQGSHSIAIRPLFLWAQMANGHVVSAFMGSMMYPIAATLLMFARATIPPFLKFGWTVFCLSLAQWILLVEQGPRLMHANFYWAIVPALHLLFICSFCALEGRQYRTKSQNERLDLPVLLCRACLVAHIISGVWFLVRSTRIEFA